jgi:hypothetical protein
VGSYKKAINHTTSTKYKHKKEGKKKEKKKMQILRNLNLLTLILTLTHLLPRISAYHTHDYYDDTRLYVRDVNAEPEADFDFDMDSFEDGLYMRQQDSELELELEPGLEDRSLYGTCAICKGSCVIGVGHSHVELPPGTRAECVKDKHWWEKKG